MLHSVIGVLVSGVLKVHLQVQEDEDEDTWISGTTALGQWCNIPENLNCYLLLLLRSGAIPLQESQKVQKGSIAHLLTTDELTRTDVECKNVWSPIRNCITTFIVIRDEKNR